MIPKSSSKEFIAEIPVGVKVVVPDSLHLITPYVLKEQGDWFEDEIKFIRILLLQGQKCIDIGANYGTYTLSMAQVVGKMGGVWAFEPASETAGFLQKSIDLNGFSQVALSQVALSFESGNATLELNANSELNSLSRGTESSIGASEIVPVTTLDECLVKYAWEAIEFLKIDAEGEEQNILRGGELFFSRLSPLVEFELKAGADIHLELVRAFESMGYESYRLVPGLNILIPFDEKAPVDGYLLNLFCCKADRAAELFARGLLIRKSDLDIYSEGEFCLESGHHWRVGLSALPYASELDLLWTESLSLEPCPELEQAITCYLFSQDTEQSHVLRYLALEQSFSLLGKLCAEKPLYLRLATLARVARDFGERALAVQALNELTNHISKTNEINPREPFLSPSRRLEAVAPNGALGNWIFTSILESLESFSAFSSFYTRTSAFNRLQVIQSLGFAGPEMTRRFDLIKKRFTKP
jgi:FkbM family methyltransferase